MGLSPLQTGQELDTCFREVSRINGNYDLVLVDPPYSYPSFHNSSIPYNTNIQESLLSLSVLFDRVMNNNSILLLWTFGKMLPLSL